jgi:hypothetical protein
LEAFYLKFSKFSYRYYIILNLIAWRIYLKTEDISNFPVMKKKCTTCPFHRRDKIEIELANTVEVRCMTQGSQICHHPVLSGKEQDHLCRGARDYQLSIFYRLGVIKAETDEAWDKAWKKASIKIKNDKRRTK